MNRGEPARIEAAASEERTRGLLEQHARAFERAFGVGDPPRTFFSPGRVNLMGAHLDYNGGPVMPIAIDRGTFLAVRIRPDRRLVMRSTSEAGEFRIDLDSAPWKRRGQWVDYPLGVAQALLERASAPQGLEILFGGNLPVGAGLSSSASICVGTACALDRLWDGGLSPLERALVALHAERDFVGVQCGIMDPYAIALAREGHILWLDCRDASVEHLPLDHGAVRIAVADSGVRRELAQSAFNQRVDEARRAFQHLRLFAPDATCLRDIPPEVLERHGADMDRTLAARAEHVVREVERTFQARAALLRGDLAAFGSHLLATHASLRDLYQVSVPELDCLVEAAASESAVLGARLTGAGFGGCVVLLMRADAGADVGARIAATFERRFGRTTRIELFSGDRGPREIQL